MKKGVITLCIMLTRLAAEGQYSEFITYDNGLIYDTRTMNRLSVIVDSLNIRFRTCDLSHPYYSFPQGVGYYVELSKAQQKAISDGITLEEFRSRFPKASLQEIWVIKRPYREESVNYIRYAGLPFGWGDEPSVIVRDRPANNKERGWVIDEEGSAAFFLTGLKQVELAHAYARMVQYVDCMIDTTALIYLPEAEAQVYQVVKPNSKAESFLAWANDFTGKPDFPSYETIPDKDIDSVFLAYEHAHRKWDSARLHALDEKIEVSHYWKSLLMEARDEALSNGNTDSRLEFYVARYLSKEDALRMKRSRRVMGYCSQDLSPRYHAVEICQLAAETAKWDIFLRSHLDVMNDRFARQSDGSYAWEGRKTYLKELEELNIDATDLLLGTCLRVVNVSPGHYRGDIGRVGRALAESRDRDAVEAKMAAVILDGEMDVYNRLLFAYLFSHYVANLEDSEYQERMKERMDVLVASLPAEAQAIWKKN